MYMMVFPDGSAVPVKRVLAQSSRPPFMFDITCFMSAPSSMTVPICCALWILMQCQRRDNMWEQNFKGMPLTPGQTPVGPRAP